MKNEEANIAIADLIGYNHPRGYELLYERYSAILYGCIIRIVKDTEAAEHLLKNTFENICSNMEHYCDNSLTFLTIILGIARSKSIEYLCETKNISPSNFLIRRHESSSISRTDEMVPSAVDKVCLEAGVFDMVLKGFTTSQIAEKFCLSVDDVKLNIRKGMKIGKRAI